LVPAQRRGTPRPDPAFTDPGGTRVFYETRDNRHGLPHDPFKSCVVPRCIGWISSISAEGVVNLAPYSFFNAVSTDPHMVAFGSGGRHPHGGKDTISNVEATGEFVCNLATFDLREQMSLSSAATSPEVDEFDYAGLEAVPATLVRPPRVRTAPIHLECVHYRTIDLPCHDPDPLVRNGLVIGEVVGVHISDEILSDGMVDMSKFRPIARLGYMDYSVTDNVFTMPFPD
jgi:flavin reductase (DIM6/NTAB) family NADH-FMN oxidoreductase RutF